MAADGKSFSGKWRYGNSGGWNDWLKSNRKTTVLPSAGNSFDGSNSGESTTVTVTVTSTSTGTGSK